MRVGEFRGLAGRLAVDQARGPMGIELHHPVPHDLDRDPADPGRLGAGRSLIDRGQRQQPSGLRPILGLTGDRAQGGGVEVSAERNRHGEPPAFATLNQTRRTLKTPTESRPQGLGIMGLMTSTAATSRKVSRETRRTMATFGLREAALQAGVDKSTIHRAIQSGRLSAARTENGGYSIDAAELLRVYPPKPVDSA